MTSVDGQVMDRQGVFGIYHTSFSVWSSFLDGCRGKSAVNRRLCSQVRKEGPLKVVGAPLPYSMCQ